MIEIILSNEVINEQRFGIRKEKVIFIENKACFFYYFVSYSML